MSFAFVFPGQGSQSIGMLAALSQTDPVVRATFDEASAALGYDLWQLTQEGPKERLDSTECTQPAMLAAGVATWRLWHQRGGADPIMVSGHSLGEFTAFVCAGAIDLGHWRRWGCRDVSDLKREVLVRSGSPRPYVGARCYA